MELIKIEEREGKKLVSGRELHEFLEVKDKFSTWINRRIEKYDFIENEDFTKVSQKCVTSGQTIHEYIITTDVAKELSMVENNDKGREARRYFIECEKVVKTLTTEDMIIMQAESVKALRMEVAVINDKIDNKMGLSGSQAYCIQNLVNRRVYQEAKKLFEVEEITPNMKKSIKPMFSEINKLIKIKFGISHRNDIPQSKYEEATNFINNWYISMETQLKVINKFEELMK